MKKFKIFCMKKRAGLLRLENPDPEAVRQFACMYLVVANISIVHRMPINAIMDTRRGRKRVSEARQLSQYLCHISFRQVFFRISANPLNVTGPVCLMLVSALRTSGMSETMIWRQIVWNGGCVIGALLEHGAGGGFMTNDEEKLFLKMARRLSEPQAFLLLLENSGDFGLWCGATNGVNR